LQSKEQGDPAAGEAMPDEDEEVVKAQLDRIEDDVKVIKELLTGNGDPSKGLIIRVDRLEQAEQRRVWAVRTSVGAAIGSMLALIIKLFIH